jgi:transglutaminase-like putative cysteine protease
MADNRKRAVLLCSPVCESTMSIQVAVKHHTRYRFDRAVKIGPHLVRLRPAPHCRTPIQAYSLKVEPSDHFINWQQDPFGNYVARLVFPEKTRDLSIDVELIADMTVINPFDFFLEESAQHYPFEYEPRLVADLAPYLQTAENGALLCKWVGSVDRSRCATADFLVAINRRVQQGVNYLIRMEPGVQTCEQTLQLNSGSCRDSAWLLVQVFRHLGLAARFVSGYLVQLTADLKALDGPSGPERDFTDLHAWAEVYIPGAGWIGLDPTSGLFAAEGHIPLACTPDPSSAAPVTGVTGKCEVSFEFYNKVTRIHEDPRVTRPFSAEQWQTVMDLGVEVDRRLQAQDVRLTMGGEPTFVSMDDMQGAEWNNAALGAAKRELAGRLLLELRAQFAPGGLLHFGQGKWYPGEPLPRWALSLYWREDGLQLWQDPRWLADDGGDHSLGLEHAEQFINALARQLGLQAAHVTPGYEDVYYYLWKEGTLPDNVDPLDSKLSDPLERKRLRALFERGLDKVTGFALPLRQDDTRWNSCAWKFKRERMYLLPGDSPMGLRLPLNTLLWQPPEKRDHKFVPDPFEERAPLSKTPPSINIPAAQPEKEADDFVNTALCVEARAGKLYIFLPPLLRLEHFVDLVAQIEAVAARLQMPVMLEGYEPPRDPRLRKLQVTPDPGVIEVNIHPARDWPELVHIIDTVYEGARRTRLGAEKFMLDAMPGLEEVIMSRLAASRLPTARSCVAPNCWEA